ncbi:putative selenate ABC transporter substrate-binding protein [Bacillus sp. FJAT-27225]|uniref:putative selenate ABC transporter substrate-binding protein n=1 Tax=Bacillus sp. FJAT-27225 TaxID=1743144 RepID=UPI00080C3531|nr:putative selenate ABC transporter substrate-binding protein [Bacillus sp. FJAT-27225]OCA90677.1 putative selenate ABC transporter substrate-binding protein [Bacillus sp. FJAT-27225]
MKKWLSLILASLFVLTLAACGGTDESKNNASGNKEEKKEEQVIKIGAIPDQSATELNSNMESVAKTLSEKTGMKVEFVPSVDYAALVTAFQRGEIHLAWFGGLTGVQARNLVPEAEAIAQRPRDAEFKSVFITNDASINSLADLKGKTFTFGSESSTSGHLMPRYFLMEEGIDAAKDFDGQPNFSGSHDTTYKLVESGAFKAGALNIAVWETAVAEKKVDTNKVRVFYTTPPYYDYNWTINKMDGETKKALKDALLSMTAEELEGLDMFATDKFVETNNENYQAIEKVAKELKIIK